MLGIGTILSGIFSSAKIYLLIGVAFIALCGLAYIEHLYARAYKAEAALSSAEATINESKALGAMAGGSVLGAGALAWGASSFLGSGGGQIEGG